MTKTILRLAALSMVALLLFAPTAGAQGKTTTVSIKDFAFDPPNATVAPGTTVAWVNDDQVASNRCSTLPAMPRLSSLRPSGARPTFSSNHASGGKFIALDMAESFS